MNPKSLRQNHSHCKAGKEVVGYKNINGKKVIHVANDLLVIPYHFGTVDPGHILDS